ncbi:hypothetical protein NPIL_135531 [Nephila pilipes]|uniref:Uncharacterized protein n=1 Tax=Nephila pilipes TaxID=299642 RepID=A0A8X6N779_NEPPI|nr:hypothetical protein NPIL_135531 [Nephila pilipes]
MDGFLWRTHQTVDQDVSVVGAYARTLVLGFQSTIFNKSSSSLGVNAPDQYPASLQLRIHVSKVSDVPERAFEDLVGTSFDIFSYKTALLHVHFFWLGYRRTGYPSTRRHLTVVHNYEIRRQ